MSAGGRRGAFSPFVSSVSLQTDAAPTDAASALGLVRPLQRYVARFPLLESLDVVRAYLQHLQLGHPLPANITYNPEIVGAGRDRGLCEWTVETLAKELILHAADYATDSLREWAFFATALNNVNAVEDNITAHYPHLYGNHILIELYRIAHRQFPWQSKAFRLSALLRYFKIFGDARLEPLLRRRLGVDARALYLIGITLTGHYLDYLAFSVPPKMEGLDITLDEFNHVARAFSAELGEMRRMIEDAQSYDQDYAYTFNPLRSFPLLRAGDLSSGSLLAPIPTFLFQRFTGGIYYELCDAPGFSVAFGPSFQSYIGDVLAKVSPSSKWRILPEQPYHIGKRRKDSVDWIVSDETGDLFIECKAKRVRYGAKSGLASIVILTEDLDTMAGFVVQAYKTLSEACTGAYPHWKDRGKAIFPVIVFLEVFGDVIIETLRQAIVNRMDGAQMDRGLTEKYPYVICSAEDFEIAMQIIGQVGIARFMEERRNPDYNMWAFSAFMNKAFRDERRNIRGDLFADELHRIHPALALTNETS
jgi:hypothetical protein